MRAAVESKKFGNLERIRLRLGSARRRHVQSLVVELGTCGLQRISTHKGGHGPAGTKISTVHLCH